MDMVQDFLTSMYTNRADFVFTVSRDFVRSIQTLLLVAPDDVPAHRTRSPWRWPASPRTPR
jgi:hypothetical protein